MKYTKNQPIERIKILIFILVFFVFLIVLIKNLNISIFIKEFIIGVAFLLFIIYLFLMYFEVKKLQLVKVKLPTNDVSDTINDKLTFRKLFKKNKFEEFKKKILTLNCVKNDFTWVGKKQNISALYYKLNNNNYLIAEESYDKKDFEELIANFLKCKFADGLLSKHKINSLSIIDRDGARSEIEKFYMNDLNIFGDN